MNKINAAGSGNQQAVRDVNIFKNGSYQAGRDVNLYNNFRSADRHPSLEWLIAMGKCMEESVIILDNYQRVIYMNNAFGSFDGAEKLETLRDIIVHLAPHYYNPTIFDDAISITIEYFEPLNFIMRLKKGGNVFFKCYPVVDQSILVGVVITAWKESHKTINQTETSTSITQR